MKRAVLAEMHRRAWTPYALATRAAAHAKATGRTCGQTSIFAWLNPRLGRDLHVKNLEVVLEVLELEIRPKRRA